MAYRFLINKNMKRFHKALETRRKIEVSLLKAKGYSDYAAEFGIFHWY